MGGSSMSESYTNILVYVYIGICIYLLVGWL